MPIRGRYNPFNLIAFNKRLDHGLLLGLDDDDHAHYWADTTIGTRGRNYETTGTIKAGGTGSVLGGTEFTTTETDFTLFDTNGTVKATRFKNSTAGPAFIMRHARVAGSAGDFLNSADEVGRLRYSVWDGSAFTSTAQILGFATQNHSSTNLGTALHFYTTPDDSDTQALIATMKSDADVVFDANIDFFGGVHVEEGVFTINKATTQMRIHSGAAEFMDISVDASADTATFGLGGMTTPLFVFTRDTSITGDLTVDTDTFFVDSTANTVKIGSGTALTDNKLLVTMTNENVAHSIKAYYNERDFAGSGFAIGSFNEHSTGSGGLTFERGGYFSDILINIQNGRTNAGDIVGVDILNRLQTNTSGTFSGEVFGVKVRDQSNGSGTFPTNQYQVYLDTPTLATNNFGIFQVGSSTKNVLAGSLTTAGRIVRTDRYTTTQTLDGEDHHVFADTDGGAFTITLPATPVDGQTYRIINVGSSGNDLTIARNGNLLTGGTVDRTLSDSSVIILTFETTEGWW